MKSVLQLITLFVIVTTSLNSQNSYWKPSNAPFGGNFNLIKGHGDTLYAMPYTPFSDKSDWQKCYLSTDHGYSWQKLTFLQDFIFNAPDNYVYIGERGTIFIKVIQNSLESKMYKTTDLGQSWSQIETESFAVVETPTGTLLRRSLEGIKRSTDGGINWTTVIAKQDPNHVFFDVVLIPSGGMFVEYRGYDDSTLFRTLYKSFDDGTTWSSVSLDSQYSSDFYFAPSGTIFCRGNDYRMYRSTDGGTTFNLVVDITYFSSLTTLLSGRILAGDMYSDDDGLTWHTLQTNNETGIFLPITPLADGTIFQLKSDALYRSSDGGQTWNFSGEGMRSSTYQKLFFQTDSEYYANTYLGVFKTSDAGEHWKILSKNATTTLPSSVMAITELGSVVVAQEKKLYWSSNGDSLEIDITPTNGLWPYHKIVLANPRNDELFVATSQGLERSVNQGQSWQLVYQSTLPVTAVSFHPAGKLMICHNEKDLFIADDTVFSWQSIAIPGQPTIKEIRIAGDGTIYALGYLTLASAMSIWRSDDAGISWIRLPKSIDGDIFPFPMLECSTNGFLFLTEEPYNLYLSVNKGETWQNIDHPLEAPYLHKGYGHYNTLAITPNQYLIAGAANFGLWCSVNSVETGSYLEGYVRKDADADCSTADAQDPINNQIITAQSSTSSYFTTTNTVGKYEMLIDTGTYQVSVTNPNFVWWQICDSIKTAAIPAYNSRDTVNFSMVALSECPLISVNIAAPIMRRCFDNEVSVNYCNIGAEPTDSAWIDITLDPYLAFISSEQIQIDQGNNVIRFYIGELASGECGNFQLVVNVDCDATILGQTHCISAHAFPDTLCTTLPNWSGANLEAQVACQDSVVNFIIQNNGPAASQILDYIIIEDDVVMFQGSKSYNPDESLTIPLTANGHTYRLESEQEPGHPFSYRVIAFEEGCGGFESLGYINQFSVNGYTPSIHRICVENTGSYDPNDKRGYPFGTGTEHRIRPGQPIEYMIRFQNTGTDTAFTVMIRDTLPQWLNPASVMPGAASHPYSWTLEGQGVVKFTFNNILLPDSTTNLAASQGFVTFSVAQQPDVPLGTQIRNDAAIFFDFNVPVMTNETLHTVGLDLLISTVELPSQRKAAAVAVSPNPAPDYATFQLLKGNFKNHRLQLFDPLGKPVFDTEVNGAQFVMPRGHLPAGAYGWRVADHRGVLLESGVVVFE